MSRYSKDKPKRPDRRKIPDLFRAVEKDDRPTTYYGQLISDDHFNFVAFACHNGEDSIVKERVLQKHNFSFSKIDKDEFEREARRGIAKMKRATEDARMELDAAEYNQKHAETWLAEALR